MRAPFPRERVRLRSRRMLGAALVLALVATSFTMGASPLAIGANHPLLTTEWLGYHGGNNGAGIAVGLKGFNTTAPKWTSSTLDGQVYGEPLVYRGEVVVATENNSIYALSATNGHVLWRKHLATAVPSNMLPCGDISPVVGITGTPVIDPARQEVFALAFELIAGTPVHYLVGLGLTRGAL